nr:hypothetical protein [Tanacetum cinerariifolium]
MWNTVILEISGNKIKIIKYMLMLLLQVSVLKGAPYAMAAPLRREAWSPYYEIDHVVGSRRDFPIQSSIWLKHDLPLQPRWENDPRKLFTAPDLIERSSSRLISDQSSNPTSSTHPNPKGRNRRRSKQRIENSNLEEHSNLIVTMADQRTMAELLRAPTKGYAEAIVVPPILVEQFKLKHSLINMMTTDQFFGLEKDNPHDHIRWSSPPVARKRTLAYKDLLRACPHHGFTEFHKLDTFYNALNPADQDSLNAAAGGNLLERSTQDVLTIIENKSKIDKLTHAVNQQMSVVTTAMTAMLKQFKQPHLQLPLKLLRKLVLLAEVLICITNVSPPVATLSQNSGIISMDTFQQPQLITIRVIPVIVPQVDERVEETFTDPDLAEYTIKVPPHPVQKYKPSSQREFVVHQRDPRHPNIPYPSRMLKQK